MDKLSYSKRRRVKYIASDTVSPVQYAKLRGVFHLLERCALGPPRLEIAAEQTAWAYKSELPIPIRKVLSKFNPVEHGEAASGNFYNGEHLEATSFEEYHMDAMISQPNCTVKACRRIRRINCETGMKSRAEFCTHMVDMSVSYPGMS